MTTPLFSGGDSSRRSGGIWEYVSPSRLLLWLKCPLAFRLRYVEGIATPPSPSQFVGRIVHRALETYYRHRQIGTQLATAEVTDGLVISWNQAASEEGVIFEHEDHENTCLGQAVELVSTYLGQLPGNEPRPQAVELAVEAPLIDPATGENLGLPLLGIMDLVLAETTGPLITDFKTAARGGEPLEVTHEIQLSSYSYLFRHVSPESEGAIEIRSLIKTKVPRIEYHRYARRSEVHFQRLFAVIRAYLDDLDRGRFIFRPGLACSGCEFRHTQCQSWGGQ